jgi:hypothetical protein
MDLIHTIRDKESFSFISNDCDNSILNAITYPITNQNYYLLFNVSKMYAIEIDENE